MDKSHVDRFRRTLSIAQELGQSNSPDPNRFVPIAIVRLVLGSSPKFQPETRRRQWKEENSKLFKNDLKLHQNFKEYNYSAFLMCKNTVKPGRGREQYAKGSPAQQYAKG